MDEDAYRETYRRLNPLPCVFEKAILRACCHCGLARRLNLAEREAVACGEADAQHICRTVLDALHEKSVFTVQAPGETGPLPHGKEIRIQCGGLMGLRQAMGASAEGSDAADVVGLLRSAMARYGDREALPYQEIVRAISAFRNRTPR